MKHTQVIVIRSENVNLSTNVNVNEECEGQYLEHLEKNAQYEVNLY